MDQTMIAEVVADLEERFRNKIFLTLADITSVFECSEEVVYNWNKRHDPKRRPPKVPIGRDFRFPKRPFLQWLAREYRGLFEDDALGAT
jgi:hypothetical protein